MAIILSLSVSETFYEITFNMKGMISKVKLQLPCCMKISMINISVTLIGITITIIENISFSEAGAAFLVTSHHT